MWSQVEDLSVGPSVSDENTVPPVKLLRVRILNQVTRRYKDLLVNESEDLNVYDEIYNSRSVQDANVRKWGATLARQVKSGSLAIQCVASNGANPEPPKRGCVPLKGYHVFSVAELQSITTSRLAELGEVCSDLDLSNEPISGTAGRVTLYLQCVSTRLLTCDNSSVTEDSLAYAPSVSENTTTSRSFLNTTSMSEYTATNRSYLNPGVSLPPQVVREVFPYHIIFDKTFRILQVGKDVYKLFRGNSFVGQSVCDLLNLTKPVPMEGLWDWSTLESLKEKTVFLSPRSDKSNVKVKGSLIEIPSFLDQKMMLILMPDVKNTQELASMNLTMTDLSVHSCQRDAVLVGEHSASEVQITHKFEKRYRDLINSMEQQIEDRTRELAEANSRLEQHSARQLEHFACMSHEIRTPLNCIVGMTSLMMDAQEEMSPPQAEAIHMIHGSGELLKAVVDDVLDFAKLESGSFETVIGPADIQKTLDIVVHSVAKKLQDKNVILRTHFGATIPKIIETDSRRLQQILYNLLGNAGKFSRPSSPIDLTVTLVASDSGTEQKLRFSVKDYGTGIKKEDFTKIFKPFSQASKETQVVYGGTGLGLSITSKLVQRLGGSISVDSEVGKFTEFMVDLPFHGKVVEIRKLTDSLSQTAILVVEPDTISEISEQAGFEPDVIQSYGLALQRFNSCKDLASIPAHVASEHYTLLVHEDLFHPEELYAFSACVGPLRHTVLTYGPQARVAATRDRHIVSLTRVLPSILLGSIATCIKPQLAALRKHASSEEGSVCSRSSIEETQSFSESEEDSSGHLTRENLRVLYAEDNKINQKVLNRVLQHVGVTNVTIVDTGMKAVEKTAEKQFDVIFMDMQMPVMDGLDATRLIMERDPTAVVIFVTAHALDEFKHQANEVGATGFISKPFQKSDIENLLISLGCVE